MNFNLSFMIHIAHSDNIFPQHLYYITQFSWPVILLFFIKSYHSAYNCLKRSILLQVFSGIQVVYCVACRGLVGHRCLMVQLQSARFKSPCCATIFFTRLLPLFSHARYFNGTDITVYIKNIIIYRVSELIIFVQFQYKYLIIVTFFGFKTSFYALRRE